jgi:hypothetical protein
MEHRQRRLLIPIRLVTLRGKLGNGIEPQARGELELALSLCYVQLVLGFFQSTLDVFYLVQPSFFYTEPESVSQIRSDLDPLTSLPDFSQSSLSSTFPLLLQLLLDFVLPLHAEGVTFVLQTIQFDLERRHPPF